jgi:putative copper export protein
LAAAAWTGGLLFLVTEKNSPRFEASAQRVSQFALAAAVTIAATGVLQTWLILDAFDQLLGSSYGLLVLAKTAGFAGLLAFGAYHRFRILPTIRVNGAAAGLSGSVRKELTLAAAVVVIAAVLSHVPPTP